MTRDLIVRVLDFNRSARRRLMAGVLQAGRRGDVFDFLTCIWIVAVAAVALFTVRDYAISNDEGVQHHYAQLILNYYSSGFVDRDLFAFHNLYLYGGLFDVVTLLLAKVIPLDPFELSHILCVLSGIGGIAASAATARIIAGSRAALIAAVALSLCGQWYGAMFNHTKDIPFAAAMMGATLVLVRATNRLPSPGSGDRLAFGLLTGAALGIRSLGLLLLAYLPLAILLKLPSLSWSDRGLAARFVVKSLAAMLPATALACLIMLISWPWAALSPLNPIRGLLAFSEFHYEIRTLFAGTAYQMADVPRWYVPVYILIKVPLVTLAGAAAAMIVALLRGRLTTRQRRDAGLLALTVLVPLACQVALHGPAFTGMRHFLFLLPPLTALTGIGLNEALRWLNAQGRALAMGGVGVICACFLLEANNLYTLHPYENLSYNSLVGGIKGAYRNYDLDYWFNSMPEAIRDLEAYLREARPSARLAPPPAIYSVAVCGERLSFDRNVTLPQLRFDFRPEWRDSEFFVAPTNMNCDQDLDGDIVATVARAGVPIAYVKDRRSIMNAPTTTMASPRLATDAQRQND